MARKIQTVNDAMRIFEACRQGILQRTTRRLLEKEKEELRSGQVLWSPSRIIKDFLVYRELSTRDRSVKRDEPIDEGLRRRVQAEGLKVHQCSKGTFILRNNGFLKKTISIKFNGTYQHMIIYEDGIDVETDELLPPQAFEELRFIQPGFNNNPFDDLMSSINYNQDTIITTGTEENESSKFAKVDNNGTGFILNDKPFYIVGANYWQAMNLGMSNKGEEREGGNRSRVIKDLTTLKKYGINCIRIMAGTEGPPGEPQRMYPALMNYPGEYDEKVFQGLDWFLDQLRNFEMTAIMGSKDFTEFEKYAARFYSDPKILEICQNYYLNHVKTVVNRKNTINDSSAGYIKSLDSNHLVTTGSESKNGEEWFVTMHKSKNIDFSCAHVWVENWGYYNSDDSSIENYQIAENFMLNFLQNVSDWSINILHKPIILEEYGK
ncbi:1456_t:CDS:2 [Diversispora eburnea]|uniref:mannan endo-1,4-beta-mannosidase n=1 Tax=Diversispora eburnea TaxID=1213867 RepID=A0A9N9B2W6_9GLOM|nr:1456_t:CDS:2 [Diversispora eburnea]